MNDMQKCQMNSYVCSNARRGFTLIELLVVISIIALLISLLLPALASIRDNANSVVCLSNQKQIYTAISGYAADRDGRFHRRLNWGRWNAPGSLTEPIDPDHEHAYWGVAYADYAGRSQLKEVFNCPNALTHDPAYYGIWYTDGPFSQGNIFATYGFNGLWRSHSAGEEPPIFIDDPGSPNDDRAKPIENIPLSTPLFQDAYEHMLDGNGDMPWSFTQWNAEQNREYFRHNGETTGNFAFVDGSAKAMQKSTEWNVFFYLGMDPLE